MVSFISERCGYSWQIENSIIQLAKHWFRFWNGFETDLYFDQKYFGVCVDSLKNDI